MNFLSLTARICIVERKTNKSLIIPEYAETKDIHRSASGRSSKYIAHDPKNVKISRTALGKRQTPEQ
jgi:hypothetical protein